MQKRKKEGNNVQPVDRAEPIITVFDGKMAEKWEFPNCQAMKTYIFVQLGRFAELVNAGPWQQLRAHAPRRRARVAQK